MIKNLLIGSYAVLAVSSFSFWKMERLYKAYDSNYTKMILSKNKTLLPKRERESPIPSSVMLYEDHTNIFLKNIPYPCMLTCSNWSLETSLFKKRELLLSGDIDYDNEFLKQENLKKINRDEMRHACSFVNYQKLPLLFKDGLAEINPNTVDIELLESGKEFNNLWDQKNWIQFRQKLCSFSGIKIENFSNHVTLSNENKCVNLKTALKNYFKKSSHDAYLSKKNYSLLKRSTILAIWKLIPVKVSVIDIRGHQNYEVIESQIIGLAKDKKGNLFYWTTDLKKDISTLMEYAPNISKQ